MKSLSIIEWVAFALVIIGGINWGLVGLLKMDLVAMLFGDMSFISRAVYILVGAAALFVAVSLFKIGEKIG